MTQNEVKLRLFIFRGLVILAFAFLAYQTWYLQITRGQEFRQLADRNRFREVTLDAPRGVLYDRNGIQLVRNRPTFDVVVIPAYLPAEGTARARAFARLSQLLDMPITLQRGPGDAMTLRQPGPFQSERSGAPWERSNGDGLGGLGPALPRGIRDIVDSASLLTPYQPVIVKNDADPIVISKIEEASLELPGVLVETSPMRDYIDGELTAHIVGYIGSIPQALIEDYKAKGYSPDDKVGLSGLELEYEDVLHSSKGHETIEVDVSGRKLRTVGEVSSPRPGHNLKLTLDLKLQKAVAEALAKGVRDTLRQAGVAIVMDPRNGQILAMVSIPAFDNNKFAGGISVRDYLALSRDKRRPLLNHAISGLYPPGSVFKIVPATGALQEGVVTPDTIIVDRGVLYLPNEYFPEDEKLAQPFYCWYRDGHGPVNLRAAIAFSCDVYFYQIAGGYPPSGFRGLGIERLGYYAELFGLGSPTGIDLPGELAGLVPTPKWKRYNYAETWVTGDTYNVGIGQGFVLATPLQMLNAISAVANGGRLYRPYLVQEVLDADGRVLERHEPELIRNLLDYVSPENLALVRQGLEDVVTVGTAKELDVPGIPVAGKTGTAEYCDSYPACVDRQGRVKTSHAWFVAYAPAPDPEIAVIVFVYGGGEGSVVAMPIAAEILRGYFGLTPTQPGSDMTPTEPLAVGPPPPGAAITARLLAADGWGRGGAAVTGFVLNLDDTPLPGVVVNVLMDLDPPAEDILVAQVVSGPTGQFDYNAIEPARAARWRLELPDYPDTAPVTLDVEAGYRYVVEFQVSEP